MNGAIEGGAAMRAGGHFGKPKWIENPIPARK